MININQKQKDRYSLGLKKYKKILTKAINADINESDTVTIIVDILHDIFGYDKYENITSEYNIKKTFCDLAIVVDGELKILIECKAIGLKLKQDFIRQATNYAVTQGLEWVILTNGIDWQLYNIVFSQPVEQKLIDEFSLLELNVRNEKHLELLHYLSIECNGKNSKSTLNALKEQKKIINRYFIGQLLIDDVCVQLVRKQIKKLNPTIKVTDENIKNIITTEILKREIIEGDDAEEAKKRIVKLKRSIQRKEKKKE